MFTELAAPREYNQTDGMLPLEVVRSRNMSNFRSYPIFQVLYNGKYISILLPNSFQVFNIVLNDERTVMVCVT